MIGSMAMRRRLKGKKLLVATMGIGASSFLGCGGEVVANLVAPPEDAGMDAQVATDADVPMDVMFFPDGPVANLIAPPEDAGLDSGASDSGAMDAAVDAGDADGGSVDAGEIRDVMFFPDGPIANLIPPPPDSRE